MITNYLLTYYSYYNKIRIKDEIHNDLLRLEINKQMFIQLYVV